MNALVKYRSVTAGGARHLFGFNVRLLKERQKTTHA